MHLRDHHSFFAERIDRRMVTWAKTLLK